MITSPRAQTRVGSSRDVRRWEGDRAAAAPRRAHARRSPGRRSTSAGPASRCLASRRAKPSRTSSRSRGQVCPCRRDDVLQVHPVRQSGDARALPRGHAPRRPRARGSRQFDDAPARDRPAARHRQGTAQKFPRRVRRQARARKTDRRRRQATPPESLSTSSTATASAPRAFARQRRTRRLQTNGKARFRQALLTVAPRACPISRHDA